MRVCKFMNLMADENDVEIRFEGEIVDNDTQELYEYFGINAMSPSKFRDFLTENKGKNITLYIDSPGGDVLAASTIYTDLLEYKNNVTAKITGLCASAATIIAMAANKVVMSPTAQFMIHQAWGSVSGNKQDMKQFAETLKSVDESIINAYERKTGLSRDKISSLMEKETWMDANQAKEYGFVDEILGENDKITDNVKNSIINSHRMVYAMYKEQNHIVDTKAEEERLEKEKQEKEKQEKEKQEALNKRNARILAEFDFNSRYLR